MPNPSTPTPRVITPADLEDLAMMLALLAEQTGTRDAMRLVFTRWFPIDPETGRSTSPVCDAVQRAWDRWDREGQRLARTPPQGSAD